MKENKKARKQESKKTRKQESKKARKQENKKTRKQFYYLNFYTMNAYQKKLKDKMDQYVHFIYKLTKYFPKEELYTTVSQIRRASLSIVLNYIEGYARCANSVRLFFLKVSYGSFQESKYLLEFCLKENLINNENFNKAMQLAEEVGAMLWKELNNLRTDCKK